jgi:hypothetical protein
LFSSKFINGDQYNWKQTQRYDLSKADREMFNAFADGLLTNLRQFFK